MKVQAAVLKKQGEPLEIVELELRKPLAGEVIVKIRASGICHTDLSVINGTMPVPPPIVLGHEGTLTLDLYYSSFLNIRVSLDKLYYTKYFYIYKSRLFLLLPKFLKYELKNC
jgi:hypothetical protein